ncbi:sensor histidine kinase [Pseudoduganella aquatica]|uniref:Oxygen sensor histidine kinase NreB n=1 Tax=Pseudoduganella aquatica TaxID=2660641 RepID=A0A7X4HA93_9BURK|nr:ATP-binding protein [Pseudoduganella aquatica]MYN07485.1 sensor histidine kinase [Pseudoduganella aquatica]
MALAFWRGWSVRARLLSIIIVPVAYMFVTFVAYAWQSRLTEVREELAERGPLVAKVVADSSEYSISLGKLDELRSSVSRMMQSDSSIHKVELFDKARKPLLQVASRSGGQPEPNYYETPILRRLVWMNMQSLAPGPEGMTVETVGHVRVTMSSTAMLRKQTGRFCFALLVASLGLLVCALLAWHLAKQFSHSLNASIRALREADAEKRRLIRKVNSAVEEERKSIALEIHDELNATLIAVRLESQRVVDLSRKLEQGPEAQEIAARAQGVIQLALGLYNSGRALVRRLRPEVLEMLGLQGALEEMVRHYDRAGAGCRFEFQAEGDFSKLDSAVAISAYRTVQEALSNVVKHARATRVTVSLRQAAGPQGSTLLIEVADNGKGYDPAQASPGIGIIGMRERADAFGGSLAIATGHQGTTIAIRLPLGM